MAHSRAPQPNGPWHDPDWLREALARHEGVMSAVARELGITVNPIRGAVAKHGINVDDYRPTFTPRLREHEPERPPLVPREDVVMQAAGDLLVTGDWHAPMLDHDLLAAAIDDARAARIRQAVINGDLFNNDALANHERKQATAGLDPEMQHARAGLVAMLEAFDVVYVTRGNHDRHPAKALRDGVSFDWWIRALLQDVDNALVDRLRISNRDRVDVATDEGRWMIAHTYSYSRIALAYPMKLAVRHGCHVAASHRHHHAVGRAPNGFYAVDLPMLGDPARMQYVHEWTNDLPEMQCGYMLLKGGRPVLPLLHG